LRDHPLSIMAMQREARKAQELAHPNIIKVYDFDRDEDQYYITMEYLVGQSLYSLIRAPGFKPKPLPEILPMINEIGAALSFAHANGFVHCDLKPGNIFITQTGRVKVIDFGIARAIKTSLAGTEDATVFNAKELAALTPAYASPQMIDLQAPEPSDDVFALACIVYELLTGQHPFRRVPSDLARDSGMKPKRIKTLTNSQWLAITRALAFESRDRTPSIAMFLEGLNQVDRLGKLPVGKLVALAGLSAGCAAVGFMVLALWSGEKSTPAGSPPEMPDATTRAPAPPVQPAPDRNTAPVQRSTTPAPLPVKPPPIMEAPGASEARFAFGSWCGDSFQMSFGPASGSLKLPSGSEMRLSVESYQMAAGRLAVRTLAADGGRSVWEFGSFSNDGSSMVHLRLQTANGEWRNYNRRLRRC
jgi:serine/threonine protein kinase